jgi:methyl-accepting chemotaxis protein
MVFFTNKNAVQSRIDEAVGIIEKMSDGDLSVSIDTSGSDVVAPLMRALKKNLVTQERRISEGRRETDAGIELKSCLDLANRYLERIAQGEIPAKIEDAD